MGAGYVSATSEVVVVSADRALALPSTRPRRVLRNKVLKAQRAPPFGIENRARFSQRGLIVAPAPPAAHQRALWPNHRPGAGHAGRARVQVAWLVSGRRLDGPALLRSFNCRIAMPTLMGRCLWPWPAQS